MLRGHDDTVMMRFTDIAAKKWEIRSHHRVVGARQAGGQVEILCDDGSAVLGDADSRAALETLTAHLHEDRFSELLHGLLMQRGRLRWLIGEDGSLAAARDAVYRALGIDADATKVGAIAAACRDGAFDRAGLLAAAEALLSIDFGKYINPKLPTPLLNLRDWTAIDDGFCLNKTFYLQVYDPDESFRFNYCEYVMARRREPAEPGAAPDRPRD